MVCWSDVDCDESVKDLVLKCTVVIGGLSKSSIERGSTESCWTNVGETALDAEWDTVGGLNPFPRKGDVRPDVGLGARDV